MAEQTPNLFTALWKSKKFGIALSWVIFLAVTATHATPEQATDLLCHASYVICAYVIGQAMVDSVVSYTKANGA